MRLSPEAYARCDDMLTDLLRTVAGASDLIRFTANGETGPPQKRPVWWE